VLVPGYFALAHSMLRPGELIYVSAGAGGVAPGAARLALVMVRVDAHDPARADGAVRLVQGFGGPGDPVPGTAEAAARLIRRNPFLPQDQLFLRAFARPQVRRAVAWNIRRDRTSPCGPDRQNPGLLPDDLMQSRTPCVPPGRNLRYDGRPGRRSA
jgi:hypothetical protein